MINRYPKFCRGIRSKISKMSTQAAYVKYANHPIRSSLLILYMPFIKEIRGTEIGDGKK